MTKTQVTSEICITHIKKIRASKDCLKCIVKITLVKIWNLNTRPNLDLWFHHKLMEEGTNTTERFFFFFFFFF